MFAHLIISYARDVFVGKKLYSTIICQFVPLLWQVCCFLIWFDGFAQICVEMRKLFNPTGLLNAHLVRCAAVASLTNTTAKRSSSGVAGGGGATGEAATTHSLLRLTPPSSLLLLHSCFWVNCLLYFSYSKCVFLRSCNMYFLICCYHSQQCSPPASPSSSTPVHFWVNC